MPVGGGITRSKSRIHQAMSLAKISFSLSALFLLSGCNVEVSSVLHDQQGKVRYEYLPVNDIPNVIREELLSADQQSKIVSELTAAREKNERRAVSATNIPIGPISLERDR